MNKITFYVFLLTAIYCCQSPELLAQWKLMNPLPFESEIESSFFTDEFNGWVTTVEGEIYKTSDGGEKWLNQLERSGKPILSICFIDENLGFTAGCDGIIMKTTDGGNSWVQKTNNLAYCLYSIFFIDSDYGWAVGYQGKIYATTDSGENWSQQSSNVTSTLAGVQFFNREFGYAMGWNEGNSGNTIIKTTDGGHSWQKIFTSSDLSLGGCGFYFRDEQNGFVSFDKKLLSTNDGGISWNTCFEGTDIERFNSITFSSSTEGWAVGGFGNLIIHTSDAGNTWTKIDSGIDEVLYSTFNSVFFVSEDVGWVFNSGRAFYKTTDKGLTWTNQSKDFIRSDFTSIQLLSDQTIFALADNQILKTEDAGFNWYGIEHPSRSKNKIMFQNQDTGWIVGTRRHNTPGYDIYSGILLKSTDSGNTWNQILTDNDNSDYKDIFFISSSTGWLTDAMSGVAYKTTDGGNNWFLQGENFPGNYTTSFFFNENSGFIAGTAMYKTTDGGESWTEISTISNVASIYFLDENNGYVISQYTKDGLYKSEDGGNTWTRINISSETFLKKIIFVNETTGYVIANNSVFISTDSGNSWSKQVTPYHWYFSDISFIDENKGWIVGSDGLIMYTENGGLVTNIFDEKKLKDDFKLGQNYPNPFNPTTNIDYHVTEPGKVELVVYDLLGREVTKLVNEYKTSGNYEITFNGSDLSSGIYFYRLKCGVYKETRKMILLK